MYNIIELSLKFENTGKLFTMKNIKWFAAALLLPVLLVFSAGCSHQTAASSALTSSSSMGETGTGFSGETELESELQGSESSSVSSAQTAPSAPAAVSSVSSPPKAEKQATVSVTIPEGFTIAQIAARLEAKGVCTAANFIKMAQTYDFTYYPLVKAIPSSKWRAYKLEGYLYPDTYVMYVNMKPQDAVGKFLRNAEAHIEGNYKYSGMTVDKVVTLASIIEREATTMESMRMVSSVFHNRLNVGQRLEADATRVYCEQTLFEAAPPFSHDFRFYYSTYRCKELPTGPICNPGANALYAAANPASTSYYYYCTANGKFYYQKTKEEHDAKLRELGLN